jgi:hypothetical protein
MQDRHEPSDRFVERLGQDVGAEVRRRNRVPPPVAWWPAFGVKTMAAAAALVVISMAVGGAVVAAAYQNENREQRSMLASVYERKLELEKVRMDAAKQQLQDVERRVAVGIVDQEAAVETRQGVVEAEARTRIAMLNLEEVRLTGRDPRDEVSAPPTPGRDFVLDRLAVSMSIAKGALDLEMMKVKRAERRISLGLEQPSAAAALRARIVELESGVEILRRKMEIRQMFVAKKYDSTLADLRVVDIEAEQRYRALKPQYELALREKERIESLVSKGLASPIEVTKANVRVLELLTELQRAEVEVAIARQRIAERTAGKGAGS